MADFLYKMKSDTGNTMRESTAPLIHKNTTDSCSWDRATHNMNYHLIIVFHFDMDKRPCRPELQVVHTTHPPATSSEDIMLNPNGTPILTTCRLCDPFSDSESNFPVDNQGIMCILATPITDDEAAQVIANIALINSTITQSNIDLSERSNVQLCPLFLHKKIHMGVRSIANIKTLSTATDVQLLILLMRESMNPARSVCVRLNVLHPYLATPTNVYDTISTFMRKLNVYSFRRQAFKFVTTDGTQVKPREHLYV
jgi:hypothetical protein